MQAIAFMEPSNQHLQTMPHRGLVIPGFPKQVYYFGENEPNLHPGIKSLDLVSEALRQGSPCQSAPATS